MTSIPLPDRVVQAVHAIEPEITISQIERKWNLYISKVEEALLSSTNVRKTGQLNLTHIAWQSVRVQKFKHNKKQIPADENLRDLFFNAYPLFTIIEKGSNITNERTLIRANKTTLELLKNINPETANIEEKRLHSMIAEQTTTTTICLDTLHEYVAQTDAAMAAAANAAERARIERNLLFARSVETLALKAYAFDGAAYPKFVKSSPLYGDLTYATIPTIESQSSGGRVYLKGINLQNAPKEVRRAALGPCYEIDMTQCAFNIKLAAVHKFITEHPLAWFKIINHAIWEQYKPVYKPGLLTAAEQSTKDQLDAHIAEICNAESALDELKQWFPCTFAYVDDREIVLAQLRPAIRATNFDRVKNEWLKTFVTAISFGATKTKGYKGKRGYELPSLRTIIKNPEDFDRVMAANNNWIDNFILEQTVINQLIRRIVSMQENPVVPLTDEDGKKLSQSQVSALYFQHYETEIMNTVAAFAKQYNSEVILRVHDGLYITNKLPYGASEINEALREVTGYRLRVGENGYFNWPALPFYKTKRYTWFKCKITAHNVKNLIADKQAADRAEFEAKRCTQEADKRMQEARSIDWAKSQVQRDNNTTATSRLAEIARLRAQTPRNTDELPDLITRPDTTVEVPAIAQQRAEELTPDERAAAVLARMKQKKEQQS